MPIPGLQATVSGKKGSAFGRKSDIYHCKHVIWSLDWPMSRVP